MKSDMVFGLETAGWPALLVDSTNAISRANAAAIRMFGAALNGESPRLSILWSPENVGSADQFLAHWERNPTPGVALALRGKGGNTLHFTAWISAFSREGQKNYVFQLHPAATAPVSEPKPPVPSSSLPPAPLRMRPASNDALPLSPPLVAPPPQESETTFIHRQKLDCALQLARSVALDFNNALTCILGHASLLLSRAEPDHPWRSSLLEIEKSAGRAAEIASDLGHFSRPDKEAHTRAGNLNQLLQRTVESFKQRPGPEVAWALQLERDLFAAEYDEAKLQQAFVRLLENAVESLSAYGRISVQTRNVELSAPAQDRKVRLEPGAYVCVEIADTGCGIPQEVLPRIFEPFFTTKADSGHRGVGLAWVYGVVTNHGGGVAVSSQAGAGTSVRVYLPAEARVLSNLAETTDDLTGNETILVVDDEDLLLNMAETILSTYGYRVLTANSGQAALDLLSEWGSPIELLVTDLVMPSMSGRELIEQVQRLSPTTRILRTSGYGWPPGSDNEPYLAKPYTSRELLLKVRETLAAELPRATGD